MKRRNRRNGKKKNEEGIREKEEIVRIGRRREEIRKMEHSVKKHALKRRRRRKIGEWNNEGVNKEEGGIKKW